MKKFARYRKGYIHPVENDDENDINNINNTKENKLKQSQVLGYINKIEVNADVLINSVIKEKEKDKDKDKIKI